MSEEACLVKMFKFFDFANKGLVDFASFTRVLEKAGMYYPDETLKHLFDLYDEHQNGLIDYRQLAFTLMRDYKKGSQDGYCHLPQESAEQ
jgi:Ca2+-binding EF-hand superfamily protein